MFGRMENKEKMENKIEMKIWKRSKNIFSLILFELKKNRGERKIKRKMIN